MGQNNFNEVMKDRNVIALLNSLDRLIHEARLRKQAASTSTSPDNTSTSEPTPPIPPHTLPPSSLVSAHLASFLSDTSSSIAAETAELEKRNVELMETVRRQRGEIEGLVGGLERVVGDLERSAGMVQGDDVVGLTAEVKMVEEELKG
jgi:kinetochore protein NNF1